MLAVTLESVDDATAIIGLGVPWIDFDGLRIVCDRVVTIALDLVDNATTGIRVSVVRVALDRLRIICDCLVVVALDPVDARADIVGDRAVGIRLTWRLKDSCTGGLGGVDEFRYQPPMYMGGQREPQIIIKTDERKVIYELTRKRKLTAKSIGWV